MSFEIFLARSDEEIHSCFPVFQELRPRLNLEEFLPRIRSQERQSYKILALRRDGVVQSIAGFRVCEFLAWGKVLYLDDLSTLPSARGRGFASALLDRLIEEAKTSGCEGVHLDTGHARHAAHRLYLAKGFRLDCHHLALTFQGPQGSP